MQTLNKQFKNACRLIIGNERERVKIGTLGEKTLHAVLKHTFEPDETKHEIKIGNFYADIVNEKGIIEIQTRSFNAMRKKLTFFLKDHVVTIVYPIAYRKWIVWLNGETGEVTKKRKSPKVGTAYEAFYELYKIKQFLTHPNLRICLVFLDMIEYRNLDGWSKDNKKGSSRYDRIPENFVEMVCVDNTNKYTKLIPQNIPPKFTAKDLKKETKLNLHSAQTALNVLKYVGAIKQIEKQGNTLVYKIIE